MTKKRILFFAEAVTLAHVARPLVLAGALAPDLYDIHFACDPRFDHLFPDLRFPRYPVRSISCNRFMQALAKGKPVYEVGTLRDYVTEDLSLIEEISPDLVIGDFRLSLAVSAPLESLCNAAPSRTRAAADQDYGGDDRPGVVRFRTPPCICFAHHTA
jgi:UDP:flavonoid glycosyltransferase YjiC (YdhE family)